MTHSDAMDDLGPTLPSRHILAARARRIIRHARTVIEHCEAEDTHNALKYLDYARIEATLEEQ
jgi:hypothetical protein